MRFGHGVVTIGKPVASGVVSGVQEVGSGATNSLDRAVRLQLVNNDGWRQPSNLTRRQSQQPVTTLPLTSWTGGTEYQSKSLAPRNPDARAFRYHRCLGVSGLVSMRHYKIADRTETN